MEERRERIRTLASLLICLAFLLAAAALFFRYVLGALLPFLVAWALALAVRPIADAVGNKTRIPRGVVRLGVLVALFILLCIGVWCGGTRLFKELERLAVRLAEGNAVGRVTETMRGVLTHLPFSAETLEAYLEQISEHAIEAFVGVVPGVLGKLAASVPRVAVSTVITLVAAVYMSLDLERVNEALLSLCPRGMRTQVTSFAGGAWHVAGTYARAYLILMILTGVLLFIGFLVIGVEYALLLSFLVAVVDLFPVLGVGTVLVPWSVWCVLTGDPARAIGLLVLWVVVLVVRQFAEPRILAGSLGVHPLLTLVLMYMGLSLFGVWGMLAAPVLAVPLSAFARHRRKVEHDGHAGDG